MTENLTPNEHDRDDDLAEFTNQLLSGESSNVMDKNTEEQEMRDLQDTVISMQRAFGQEEPDEALAARIRDALVAEWRRSGSDARPANWFARLFWRNAASGRRRINRLALAAATVLVVILGLVLSPSGQSGSLPGTALQGNPTVAIVFLGFVLGGVLWWAIRRRS